MWHLVVLLFCCLLHRGASLRCVQCHSGTGTNVSHCVTALPSPKPCDPYMTHCIILSVYRNLGVEGVDVLMEVTRTCMDTDLGGGGTDCRIGRTARGIQKKLCTRTCTADGCNGGGRATPAALYLAVATAAALPLVWRVRGA